MTTKRERPTPPQVRPCLLPGARLVAAILGLARLSVLLFTFGPLRGLHLARSPR